VSVYARKLSPEWKEAFDTYESLCGFEMMHQEDIDSGKMTAREAWNSNIKWIADVANDCANISTPDED